MQISAYRIRGASDLQSRALRSRISKKSGARDGASGEYRESDTELRRVRDCMRCLRLDAQSSSGRAKQHPRDHVRALNTEAHRPASGVHWRWS